MDTLIGNYHGVSNNAINFVEASPMQARNKGSSMIWAAIIKNTVHFGGIWAAGNANITVCDDRPYALLTRQAMHSCRIGATGAPAFLHRAHRLHENAAAKATKNTYNCGDQCRQAVPSIAVDVSAIADYADAIIPAWYPAKKEATRWWIYYSGKFPLRLPARDFYNDFLEGSAALAKTMAWKEGLTGTSPAKRSILLALD